MKKIILLGMLIPFIAFSQTENKIEGLTINTPCELEYTRNLGNQNNYSCVFQDNNENIFQYSATVQNLFEDMKGLTGNSLQVFKDQFFKTAKENAQSNGEKTENIVLANGQKALKIESYLTYADQKFANTSILFLYKQKSFIVNLTTNELKNSYNLTDRIKIK
ncbi:MULTISPECIES: hypothetical protein [Bizionia]|uniref:DUF4252 domain-containing protein n=1 Tax=Bizionia algoritergicola TaxID=291187 RepID=A0A5D0QLB6_9FLAO|nr:MULTISPECIES: hypothetical protein [Bizionia]TYB69451.1 hypothetical protein ES675_16195 [Bizionia algoritergicola]